MTLIPVLERVEATDLALLERDGVRSYLSDLRCLRRFVEAAEVRAAGRLRDFAAAGTGAPVDETIAETARSSARHGKSVESAAKVAAEHPDLAAALDAGALGQGHLAAYEQATRQLDEGQKAGAGPTPGAAGRCSTS
ncbi:MAG: hypothetical protein R2715_13400 [Ilumatobacteraceae bacterium]